MRVRICARCPYTPRDLASHYDPDAVLHVCAKCDGHEGRANHPARKMHRRNRCVISLDIDGTAQPGVALSAKDNSVSYDTTSAKPLSVPRSAPTASARVRTAIADGCVELSPPEEDRREWAEAIFQRSGARSDETFDGGHQLFTPLPGDTEPTDTTFCIKLGGLK
jgi:hypothetical protein